MEDVVFAVQDKDGNARSGSGAPCRWRCDAFGVIAGQGCLGAANADQLVKVLIVKALRYKATRSDWEVPSSLPRLQLQGKQHIEVGETMSSIAVSPSLVSTICLHEASVVNGSPAGLGKCLFQTCCWNGTCALRCSSRHSDELWDRGLCGLVWKPSTFLVVFQRKNVCWLCHKLCIMRHFKRGDWNTLPMLE